MIIKKMKEEASLGVCQVCLQPVGYDLGESTLM